MNERYRRMIGHAAVVMIIALIAGFGLVTSLVGGFEYFPGFIAKFELFGDPGAWARAHAGGLLNGLLVIGVAVSAHHLQVSDRVGRHLSWMLIGTGYANTIFYWGALFAHNRALTYADNRFGKSDLAAIIGLTPALIFAFITIIAMCLLARAAFSRPQ